ncbi:hypothetical protein [Mucilaginibacter aquatilis]|uniref:DUF4468 domain-containing protein n=1 Tax=Mucilaginibacter aquatilis TaxID=1517760 RepID=A0A6I4IBZ9_9SPHI|nr:hypothetical protein [Mucilaginibacter aquatilis]MVN91086.1 hypothetical protein [Mucilaginibacter aquatilis]
MKNLLLIFFVLCMPVAACYAQKDSIVLNENNKYAYFKVGSSLPGINLSALATYLKKNLAGLQDIKAATQEAEVSGRGGILVYKKGLLTGQEEGRLDYTIKIDFKENKYRLIITNFEFIPYQRNRFGTFTAVDGVITPLEKKDSRIGEKQLSLYLDRAGNLGIKANELVKNFANNKASVKPGNAEIKKVDTQKW